MIKLERGRRVGKDVEVERYPSSPLGTPPEGFLHRPWPHAMNLAAENAFGKPAPARFKLFRRWLEVLPGEFGLNRSNDVRAHGALARKELSEDAWWLRCVRCGVAS